MKEKTKESDLFVLCYVTVQNISTLHPQNTSQKTSKWPGVKDDLKRLPSDGATYLTA